MSLASLPPELFDSVISHLERLENRSASAPYFSFQKPTLHGYACVSRVWQRHVEQRSFARLRLTSDDLDIWKRMLDRVTPRLKVLRSVSFKVVLPTYDDDACARFEREPDQEQNDEVFGSAIARLFAILKACDDDARNKPVNVSIDAPYAPSDADPGGERSLACELGQRRDLFQHRYNHSYLQLRRDLESLTKVTSLQVSGDESRRIAPGSAAALLGHLPCLKNVELRLHDEDRKHHEIRRMLRMEFRDTIARTAAESLTTFRLDYHCQGPSDQRFVNANVRGAEGVSRGGDSFSAVLGSFLHRCPNLKNIYLDGPICIDGGIFAPEGVYSAVEVFSVNLSLVRPDGGWYLEKDPETPLHNGTMQELGDNAKSDEEQNSIDSIASPSTPDPFDPNLEAKATGDRENLRFRTQPTNELEALLEAAGLAARRMPTLQSMVVGMDVVACPRTEWQDQAFEFAFVSHGATLECSCPRHWRMNASLGEAWKGVSNRVDYREW